MKIEIDIVRSIIRVGQALDVLENLIDVVPGNDVLEAFVELRDVYKSLNKEFERVNREQ